MHYIENVEPSIYFNRKSYPLNIYMQAYNAADRDPRLRQEIKALEEKYIQMHLDDIMRSKEGIC